MPSSTVGSQKAALLEFRSLRGLKLSQLNHAWMMFDRAGNR